MCPFRDCEAAQSLSYYDTHRRTVSTKQMPDAGYEMLVFGFFTDLRHLTSGLCTGYICSGLTVRLSAHYLAYSFIAALFPQ